MISTLLQTAIIAIILTWRRGIYHICEEVSPKMQNVKKCPQKTQKVFLVPKNQKASPERLEEQVV